MMIDYLQGKILLPKPLPGLICDGTLTKATNTGEVEWETATWCKVLGSFGAKVQIRAHCLTEIEFRGNPAKFLQGHNLFGTSDPVALFWAFMKRVEQIGGILPCSLADMGISGPLTLAECTFLTRVDATATFLLDSELHVLHAIKSYLVNARLRDRGESGMATPYRSKKLKLMTGVTFGSQRGKENDYWSITMYAKGLEIREKDHSLPDFMMEDPEVLGYANGSLRAEVRVYRKELDKLDLKKLSNWTKESAANIWGDKMARMVWNEAEVSAHDVSKLKPNQRVVYEAWTAGADLRQIYARPTFYRHRRAILSALDVDISIPFCKHQTAEVVPIRQLPKIDLNAAVVTALPAWANRINSKLREGGATIFEDAA